MLNDVSIVEEVAVYWTYSYLFCSLWLL